MHTDDDELEGVLFEAFGRAADESVLGAIERLHGASTSVLLRDTEEESAPVLRRTGPGTVGDDSRYQILGEIARGGIGIVYKGRDRDLNREVALKVLRAEYTGRPDVVQRFIEEAQVGGQLQHPGIVPVYAMGMQPDGRPSFAMKLVKGRTLAELLESNPRGVDLTTVFQQMVQTIAYAHSRGVIHRDLKPANVMVGAFGEVQVVDWGFAKVLGQEEPARPEQTIVQTVRSGSEGSQSLVGSVMGTPAYMPPEQAMGSIEDLDERADVFALGAILCQVLTGQPPYTGAPNDQLIAAAQSRLGPAMARLAACPSAEGLKQIVRDCLQPLMQDRPPHAGAVAERMSLYFADVEQRAHAAELDVVASQARAERARDAHRRNLMLSAAALLLILVGGGGWLWHRADVEARAAAAAPRITAALGEARRHEGRRDWARAVEAAGRAVELARTESADDGGAVSLLARLEATQRDAAEVVRRQAEDDAFLAELEAIRAAHRVVPAAAGAGAAAGPPPTLEEVAQRTDEAYKAALGSSFAASGHGTERLRASRHAAAVAGHLASWAALRRGREDVDDPSPEAIRALACDLDPAHAEVLTAIAQEDAPALERVARERGAELDADLAARVGAALMSCGSAEDALALLELQFERHPESAWIHVRLSEAAAAQGDPARSARHAEIAALLRSRAGAVGRKGAEEAVK